MALEFIHRVIENLEEFLGQPLLAAKIESGYDVVAQLLNEMCDAGTIAITEGNALRDLVEVEGFMGKLLGGLNLSGYFTLPSTISSFANGSNAATPTLPPQHQCKAYPQWAFSPRLLFPGAAPT